MWVRVKVPGSCGELVQGVSKGTNFLITCPIDRYSTIELSSCRETVKAGPVKVELALEKTFRYLNTEPAGYQVRLFSELPRGKGMASSSADISAACQAAALWSGQKLSADEIADIALSIEPTDGVFYPGIVMFDHLFGQLRQPLGMPPVLEVLVLDAGGEIDTLQFNRRQDLQRLNEAKEEQTSQAADWVRQGIQAGDIELIGRGATLSALANQSILPKPCLPEVIAIAQSFGSVGVNVAHSGTVLGILFPPALREFQAGCLQAVRRICPAVRYLTTAKLIAGGQSMKAGEEKDNEEF